MTDHPSAPPPSLAEMARRALDCWRDLDHGIGRGELRLVGAAMDKLEMIAADLERFAAETAVATPQTIIQSTGICTACNNRISPAEPGTCLKCGAPTSVWIEALATSPQPSSDPWKALRALAAELENSHYDNDSDREYLAALRYVIQRHSDQRAEGRTSAPNLASCCVNCGTAAAMNGEPVNAGTIATRLSPRCDCHTDFHLWLRTSAAALPSQEEELARARRICSRETECDPETCMCISQPAGAVPSREEVERLLNEFARWSVNAALSTMLRFAAADRAREEARAVVLAAFDAARGSDQPPTDADVEFLRNYAAAMWRRHRETRREVENGGLGILAVECMEIQAPIFDRIAARIEAFGAQRTERRERVERLLAQYYEAFQKLAKTPGDAIDERKHLLATEAAILAACDTTARETEIDKDHPLSTLCRDMLIAIRRDHLVSAPQVADWEVRYAQALRGSPESPRGTETASDEGETRMTGDGGYGT